MQENKTEELVETGLEDGEDGFYCLDGRPDGELIQIFENCQDNVQEAMKMMAAVLRRVRAI